MADIFISYSQRDRAEVTSLVTYLMSEGWSVWFDQALTPGEKYRDEIKHELSMARAVIVLWTPTSVASDFVRAEAGWAMKEGKLIPVKANELAFRDIPLPFGEMHIESLDKQAMISGAVRAQLSKPAVEPSPWTLAANIVRYQSLTWVGIVGGAVSLFTNLNGVLSFADWAHWVTAHWHAWTAAFWQYAFAWTGFKFPAELAPIPTFTLLSLSVALSQRRGQQPLAKAARQDIRILAVWAMLCATAAFVAITILSIYLLPHVAARIQRFDPDGTGAGGTFPSPAFTVPPLVLLGILIATEVYLIWRSPNWRAVLAYLVSFVVFYVVLVAPHSLAIGLSIIKSLQEGVLAHMPDFELTSGVLVAATIALIGLPPALVVLFLSVQPLFMALAAPIPLLNRRLSFLLCGLAVLVALNQLSIYATRIRDLVRVPSW